MSARSAGAVFAALGEDTRLALVARLSARGPQSITRLASGADVTRQAITKHLHVLAGAGHLANIERPADFNRLIEEFVAPLG